MVRRTSLFALFFVALVSYARSPGVNQDAVTKMGSRQARVVAVDLKEIQTGTVHELMVFVRVSGGQARVIGTRRLDETLKK
jgi:hypothetical protein